MTLPITIQLTEAEAHALNDLLGWAGDTIGDILDDAQSNKKLPHLTKDRQAELDENDKEVVSIYDPLFNISRTVSEMIEGTIAQNALPNFQPNDIIVPDKFDYPEGALHVDSWDGETLIAYPEGGGPCHRFPLDKVEEYNFYIVDIELTTKRTT